MDFEPQKFFIGLVDFFSVLLPGALVAYIGKTWGLLAQFGGPGVYPLDNAERWMVFLFCSYLLGHFIFLIGAKLDDWVYDQVRSWTDWGQIGRLARGKALHSRYWRKLATSKWLFGKNSDEAVMRVQWLKARTLGSLSAERAINSFQWCKARMSKEHPEGLTVVQRFEADSKFFRSFFVVLLILVVVIGWQHKWLLLVLCLVFMFLALLRYIDQRFKATQQAYWYILTLESTKSLASRVFPLPRKSYEPTHAGGIVFRRNGKEIEYLLVQASADRNQWVVPKGHIESGEDPRETAVREVREETGCWARVVQCIDDVRFGSGAGSALVRLYVMELVEQSLQLWPGEQREQQWLLLEDAKQQATFDETRALFDKAEELRLRSLRTRVYDGGVIRLMRRT